MTELVETPFDTVIPAMTNSTTDMVFSTATVAISNVGVTEEDFSDVELASYQVYAVGNSPPGRCCSTGDEELTHRFSLLLCFYWVSSSSSSWGFSQFAPTESVTRTNPSVWAPWPAGTSRPPAQTILLLRK